VSVVDRSVPVVDVLRPGNVLEGGSLSLHASTANDPDLNDTFNFEWLINGVSAGTGADLTVGVPDSGTLNVTLIAMDQAGNGTTVHVPIVVENVGPTATFGASAGSLNEGGSVTFSFSNGSDASAVDMAAGLTYSFDFNGDGVYEVTGSAPSVAHTFAQDGVYTVRGRVMDKDGGHSDYTATVNVANVAPVVTSFGRAAGDTGPVKPGSPLNVAGAFFDPGLVDARLVTVDWGDGTQTSGVKVVAGSGAGSWTFSASHVYGGGGLYTVTLHLSDGAAMATGTTSAKVTGAKLKDGTLQIVGTSAADKVELKLQGKKLVVRADFLAGGEVTYDAATVKNIKVDLAGGNNQLKVTGKLDIPLTDVSGSLLDQQKDAIAELKDMIKDVAKKLMDLLGW
jgi:hypothetical protein